VGRTGGLLLARRCRCIVPCIGAWTEWLGGHAKCANAPAAISHLSSHHRRPFRCANAVVATAARTLCRVRLFARHDLARRTPKYRNTTTAQAIFAGRGGRSAYRHGLLIYLLKQHLHELRPEASQHNTRQRYTCSKFSPTAKRIPCRHVRHL